MSQTLKHSLIIFLAGTGYGFMIPLARSAFSAGFEPAQITVAQYLVSATLMGSIVAIASRRKMPIKTIIKLLGVGVLAAGVSVFYYRALELLPSAPAVTLLFQFVWMGVAVQAIRERKLPEPITIIAVVVIMLGTVLATGFFEVGSEALALHPLGILFGLLSAAFYTAFLVASAQVATNLPAANRSFVTAIGSFLVALIICPTFFSSNAIPDIGWVGIGLGLATMVPVFLIAYSAPHLPNGLTTIMAASELPSGIVCAVLLSGDIVSPGIAIGVVIVLAGIVLSEFKTILALRKPKADSS
jgi:drug/metabolite transporter (DMT)-like permease